MYIHMYVYLYIFICVCKRKCTCICMYTHIYIYIHISTFDISFLKHVFICAYHSEIIRVSRRLGGGRLVESMPPA